MELDWTTFALEILNFLILVWILQRFLYRPVLTVIQRRRAAIADTLARAREERAAAERLQADYQQREATWRDEREQARERLAAELAAERSRRLEQLDAELASERHKAEAVAERARAQTEQRLAGEARELATAFAARLLQGLAGPELTARLARLAAAQFAELPESRLAELRQAGGPALVISAHPLAEAEREQLRRAVEAALGTRLDWQWREDAELIAGLRLELGSWRAAASLRDELSFFGATGEAPA